MNRQVWLILARAARNDLRYPIVSRDESSEETSRSDEEPGSLLLGVRTKHVDNDTE